MNDHLNPGLSVKNRLLWLDPSHRPAVRRIGTVIAMLSLAAAFDYPVALITVHGLLGQVPESQPGGQPA